MNISYEIERLINYSLNKKIIEKEDIVFSRNTLLDLLNIKEPYVYKNNEIIDENLDTATEILENLLDFAVSEKIIENDTMTERDLMNAKIMGVLLPKPSYVNNEFYKLYSEDKKEATSYFYNLSKVSNYIQVDRINKNSHWLTKTEYGDLEITINLSKPEKDLKEIAQAKLLPQLNYPKCLLCVENEGFAGNINHPARQNLRLIRLELDKEKWFMQYSPYVYYNEHCIVLCNQHVPMKTTESTFRRLLDFIEFLPHYFVGSNADIPIVGGSILTHDHYQGGCHTFPMAKAKSYEYYKHKDFSSAKISLVKWPLSIIRISSFDKEELVNLSMYIMDKWKNYTDQEADIISFTKDVPHNAITPICRKNEEGLFEIDLVLRNNRTTDEYPDGIFHPHEQLHHIKKENIGLIEVMGLAILPGRLNIELDMIKEILCGKVEFDKEVLSNPDHILNKHNNFIINLKNKYGTNNKLEVAEQIIKDEVGLIFLKVLEDAGVFKNNGKGHTQFRKFMLECSFEV